MFETLTATFIVIIATMLGSIGYCVYTIPATRKQFGIHLMKFFVYSSFFWLPSILSSKRYSSDSALGDIGIVFLLLLWLMIVVIHILVVFIIVFKQLKLQNCKPTTKN